MKKYIVYLTTNIVNNKIYVGVHGTENPDIFDGYIGDGVNRNQPSSNLHPKCPFQYAVKKYGFDKFKRSIIKVFDNVQDALDLEAEIVNEEFIKREDTYNITLGGGFPPILCKIVYQYDFDGNFIKEWSSIKEAATTLNLDEVAIGRSVLYKRTAGEFLWSDAKFDKLDTSIYTKYSPKVPVYIYDTMGEFVKGFESMSDCTKFLKAPLAHVQRSIKLGMLAGGYYVSLNLTKSYEFPKKERLEGAVHQYSLDGKYIISYNSIKEVEQHFGETMQGINTSIRLGEAYKGFLWRRGEKLD